MQFTALALVSVLNLNLFNFIPSQTAQPVEPKQVKQVSTTPRQQEVLAEKIVVVQAGETLSALAEREGSTVERLFYANTAVERPDLINVGDSLRIPTAEEALTPRPIPAAPAPVAAVTPSSSATSRVTAPSIAGGSVWDQLAQCEAGGNWAINTGNGYYGGLQFNLSSWHGVGGTGLPSDASREEQIMRGQMLQSRQGWGAWPACSAKLGL